MTNEHWEQNRTKRKWAYMLKYELGRKAFKRLTEKDLDQLDLCADEEARRILLGVSK